MNDGLASAIGWPGGWSTIEEELPQVGPGSMDIDVADAEALREWRRQGGRFHEGESRFTNAAGYAVDAIIAAIPTPPWEPDDEVVAWFVALTGRLQPRFGSHRDVLRWAHEQGWHFVKDSDG
jgi:hypothetical protein